MNILISNDDGYLAEGITILARVASEFANVRVVAPERNRSGASNSLTLDRPLRLCNADNGFYYVSGTPTDCIHMKIPDFKPDLVLSGINHGANMGDDTLYSGTVAAATEAYLMGIPAIAFSLNTHHFHKYAATAEYAIWQILRHFFRHPPVEPILWNINIPAVMPEEIQGWQITRLGRRHHAQNMITTVNPRGETVYWLGLAGDVCDNESGTDFAACEAGFVSITPLQIDLTAYQQMAKLQQFWHNLEFKKS